MEFDILQQLHIHLSFILMCLPPRYFTSASLRKHGVESSQLLNELQLQHEEPTRIYVDKKSAIALAKDPVMHDTRFHFIREHVKNKEVELISVKTQDQVADIFAKPLKADVFNKLKDMIGVVSGSEFGLRGGVEK
ncbi:hypothetical protein MRB53_016041 [Persea americana]|uniref:Uncharacterized protein n=1 Tax=Persea americana TaxID=3435 RepID=A0ACC2M2C5_PERAE|nr:hypothetical protein MRB53_016041 [Persea americana]